MKRPGGVAAVTVCNWLVAWGTVAVLLYTEPAEDRVYPWTLGLLILVAGITWWFLGRRLTAGGGVGRRVRLALWGAAALAAWLVVPFFVMAILFYPLALGGAMGAGHGSNSVARAVVLLLAAAGAWGVSWACSRRLMSS